jgi:hypothetical protein
MFRHQGTILREFKIKGDTVVYGSAGRDPVRSYIVADIYVYTTQKIWTTTNLNQKRLTALLCCHYCNKDLGFLFLVMLKFNILERLVFNLSDKSEGIQQLKYFLDSFLFIVPCIVFQYI